MFIKKIFFYPIGQKKKKKLSSFRRRKFSTVVSYRSIFSKTIELNRSMRIKGK